MIAIVTDSTPPLTHREASERGIVVVPHSYEVGGATYLESFEDENSGYAPRLLAAHGHARTEQGSAAAYATAFRQLLSQGHKVLCLPISSRLSGAYSGAQTAARSIGSPDVAVVDTHATAGALYYQIMRARELSERRLPLPALAQACDALEEKTGVAFSVEDMGALRRSRRLGFVSQSVSSILNRRPVFVLENGAIQQRGTARGPVERVRSLVQQVPRGARRLMVQGFGSSALMRDLAAALQRAFPDVQPLLRELGPVLSIHIGVNALSVSWSME